LSTFVSLVSNSLRHSFNRGLSNLSLSSHLGFNFLRKLRAEFGNYALVSSSDSSTSFVNHHHRITFFGSSISCGFEHKPTSTDFFSRTGSSFYVVNFLNESSFTKLLCSLIFMIILVFDSVLLVQKVLVGSSVADLAGCDHHILSGFSVIVSIWKLLSIS